VRYYRPDSELPNGGRHVTYTAEQLAAALGQLVPGCDPLLVVPAHWPDPRRRRILLAVLREVAAFGVRRWGAAELEAHIAMQVGDYRDSVVFDASVVSVMACEVCGRGDRIGPVRSQGHQRKMVFLCESCSAWAGADSPS
jgi:hypothetical protein